MVTLVPMRQRQQSTRVLCLPHVHSRSNLLDPVNSQPNSRTNHFACLLVPPTFSTGVAGDHTCGRPLPARARAPNTQRILYFMLNSWVPTAHCPVPALPALEIRVKHI